MNITTVLSEINNGDALTEFAAELQQVVKACTETSKVGTVSFTVSVKPYGEGKIMLTAAIAGKPPKADPTPTLFFTLENFGLSRKSPHQVTMSLMHDIDK